MYLTTQICGVNIHCGKENLASRKIAESLAFQKKGLPTSGED